MNIAIIGAGVSGIASAIVLKQAGHQVTLFDGANEIGGVWPLTYPKTQLQNIDSQYCFSNFPWPNKPDLHPTAAQVLEYLQQAVAHFQLDIRLKHKVISSIKLKQGWQLEVQTEQETQQHKFDYVICSIGQYSNRKNTVQFANQSAFQGHVITEREVTDFADFDGKRVTVVGFGKTALDMASMSADAGAKINHIFRTQRWTVPQYILGLHYSKLLFNRLNSIMMTSWVQPNRFAKWLHQRGKFLVNGFWFGLTKLFKMLITSKAWFKDKETKRRILATVPNHDLQSDLRSAIALQPKNYYRYLVNGQIIPYQAEIKSFTESGLLLNNGQEITSDIVILALGSAKPEFAFLPQYYRQLLEQEEDGLQLYRHIIHPQIPDLAFAGYNHGFMHIPAVEIATVWLCALLDDDLVLPTTEQMQETIDYITQWKRDNIHFEPSRLCAVNTRFQQYIDTMLTELEISPYRKTNPWREVFSRYCASDYQNIFQQYTSAKAARSDKLTSLDIKT